MNNAPATETNKSEASLGGGNRVDVAALELTHSPVPPEQDGGDGPSTGAVALGTLSGASFGVWEMSTGTMLDVEAEEIFVITAGRGLVVIEPFEGAEEQRVELFPGALMRLSEGMETTWTVTETLRKVYVTPTSSGAETSAEGNQS